MMVATVVEPSEKVAKSHLGVVAAWHPCKQTNALCAARRTSADDRRHPCSYNDPQINYTAARAKSRPQRALHLWITTATDAADSST